MLTISLLCIYIYIYIYIYSWKTSGLESRTELLLRLISERVLIEGCLKRRQEMLLVLHETFGQGQHPRAALLIERGTVILSELLDSKQIQREELAAMNCEMPILRAFCPQKKMEDEGYSWGFTRQIASLNILCKMDLHGWEWSNEMGEWFNEWNGSVTLSQLLTQEAHETIRSQAAHLVAYIADAKTNNIQVYILYIYIYILIATSRGYPRYTIIMSPAAIIQH